ncbi:MAG: hypothetical protein GY870_01760 [archaeon]|nr:hypothetical protein [archaeon]
MDEIQKLKGFQRVLMATCILMAIVLVINIIFFILEGGFDKGNMVFETLMVFILLFFWIIISISLILIYGKKIIELEKGDIQPQT